MARSKKVVKKGWLPVCRRIFRWCRITTFLLVIALMLSGLYLHLVGLPQFLKRPLQSELSAIGVDLQFHNVRMSWFWGFILEQPVVAALSQTNGPVFSAAEIELGISASSVFKRKLRFDSIHISQGRITQPLSATNPLPPLFIDQIDAEVIVENNEARVDNFHARFRDAEMTISGSLTNITAVRDLVALMQQLSRSTNQTTVASSMDDLAAVLEQFRWSGRPKVNLVFAGDATNPASIKANFLVSVPGGVTPWGSVTNVTLKLQPNKRGLSSSNAITELQIIAAEAQTPWGRGKKVNFLMEVTPGTDLRQPADAEVTFSIASLETHWDQTNWFRADSLGFTGRATLSWTNPIPSRANGRLKINGAATRWGSAKQTSIGMRYEKKSAPRAALADPSWSYWSWLDPFDLDLDAEASGIDSPQLQISRLGVTGEWRSPHLNLKRLDIDLLGGSINAATSLDVSTRQGTGTTKLSFDIKKLSHLLNTSEQRWISQIGYGKNPAAEVSFKVLLPTWTNPQPEWRGEWQTNLQLAGSLVLENTSFRGVRANLASVKFDFTNQVWNVPSLHIRRTEGNFDVSAQANLASKGYRVKISSRIDPEALKPLFDAPEARQLFDLIKVGSPPVIDAEAFGDWNRLEEISVAGRVITTNLSFRGERFDHIQASLTYTNQMIGVTDLRADRDGRTATAPKIDVSLSGRRVFLHDLVGSIDPYAITRAIGPKTAAAIEDYQFDTPPHVTVNGSVPFEDSDGTGSDLHFDLKGGGFHWKKLAADTISGQIHWVGKSLVLTNLQASGYRDGHMLASAWFDFSPKKGNEFRFITIVTNLDLGDFLAPFRSGTNRLEGGLSGVLNVTAANSSDNQSWQGSGDLSLKDGVIWEIPIFGIMSPVLNAVNPGMGNSRAREANGTFVISNSVIHSDNLEIKSTGYRIQYRGSVDFDQRINARVEAEPLRDVWLIGRLLSLGFSPLSKLFEFKVTGTLSEPKKEPVYIPKPLMLLVSPVGTLRDIFEGKPSPVVEPVPVPPPKPE